MKERKSIIREIEDIFKGFSFTCITLSFFMAFRGIYTIYINVSSISYPTLTTQIIWTIIWLISSLKIASVIGVLSDSK